MRRFELRAAACALGAVERPRGDRISIWCYDAAPEVFRCIRLDNRKPRWVAYVPPTLLDSDLAHSLRYRECDGVVRYRVSFGGLVYLGDGRCIDTDTKAPTAIPSYALAPGACEFFGQLFQNVWITYRGVPRQLSRSVVNAVGSTRKFRPLVKSLDLRRLL